METANDWAIDASSFLGCQATCLVGTCILYPSIIHNLGEIKGKSILDLGCGEGIFCRLVKTLGASKVVGVDISSMMINRALQDTSCQYQVGDSRNLGKIGHFDYITANFMIVYANTVEELTDMFRSVYDNLTIGGRFVGTAINSTKDANWGTSFQKYGLVYYSSLAPSGEKKVRKFKSVLTRGPDKPPFETVISLFSIDEYQKALRAAGFTVFDFKECFVVDEAKNLYPDGFWDDYYAKCCYLCVIADKI